MRKTKMSIALLALLCTATMTLSACGSKTQEVEETVVQAYDFGIPLSAVHETGVNVATQYAGYLRAGYYDAAYALIEVPANTYYTKTDMLSVETDLLNLTDDYILVSAVKSGNNVKLTYGRKIGEAFSKAKKETPAEYIGEVIKETKVINIPTVQTVNGGFAIDVRESSFTEEQIALHVPDGVTVWFGGVLLDPVQRDDGGCYILSDFIDVGIAHVKLVSDVEARDIVLVLDVESNDAESLSAADNVLVYPDAEMYNGIRRWTYNWVATRETQTAAVQYIKRVLQELYSLAENQVDFYDASVQNLFIDTETAENVKAMYMQLCNAFIDTKSKDYKELTCVDVSLADDTFMQKKGYSNEVVDGNLLRVYVNTEYSYVTYSMTADANTPHTGTSKGYVYITKNTDGEWRLCNLDNSVLKTVR